MELRAYQEKAVNLLRQSLSCGHKAPILRLDCGAGKTAIASYLAKCMAKKNKHMLFLTHLQEIAQQTRKTLQKFDVDMNFADVGMVITVSHNLEKYDPDVIICDECNFALGATWRKVLSAYPKAYIIGLSASPVRLSGEAMGDIFDDIIDFISADELIEQGYLSEYDLYAPKLNYDISRAEMRGNDFKETSLEEILNDRKLYGDILRYFNEYAADKKTICYCTTIKHSQDIAEMFRSAGYKAEHIDGTFSEKRRAEIIERFRTGETQILTNCNLISFGFDVPDCDCVVGLRPTASLCLYIQQYSRALRKNGDRKAVILDFAANVFRFGMPTEKREWKLSGRVKCKNLRAEPEILARQCGNCFRVYSGTGQICPFCGANNGRTREQIKADERAELEKITEIRKAEVRKAVTLQDLIKIGRERGYKNPEYWARMKYNNSWRRGR